MNKNYFKPGDRVKYIQYGEGLYGQIGTTCANMPNASKYVYVRFDNQKLNGPWVLSENNAKAFPTLYNKQHFKVGDKYLVVQINNLILAPRPIKNITKSLLAANRAAIKEGGRT